MSSSIQAVLSSFATDGPVLTGLGYSVTSSGISFPGISSGARVRVDTSTDFDLSTDPFTIEWWEYMNVNKLDNSFTWGFGPLKYSSNSANNRYEMTINGIVYQLDSIQNRPSNNLNTWNHFAMSRNGSNFVVRKNGSVAHGINIITTTIAGTSPFLYIGSDGTGTEINGLIADFVVTGGVDKYFNAPPFTITSKIPVDANTLLSVYASEPGPLTISSLADTSTYNRTVTVQPPNNTPLVELLRDRKGPYFRPALWLDATEASSVYAPRNVIANLGEVSTIGRFKNGVVYSLGEGSLILDSTQQQYVEVPHDDRFNPTNDSGITIQMWVRQDFGPTVSGLFLKKKFSSPADGYTATVSFAGEVQAALTTSTPTTEVTLPSDLATYGIQNWVLLTVVYNTTGQPGSVTVYKYTDEFGTLDINTSVITTDPDGLVVNTETLKIGRAQFQSFSTLYHFEGEVGAVFLYDRELSAEDISETYLATRYNFYQEPT